jgi:putative ATP-binding cassette transporter
LIIGDVGIGKTAFLKTIMGLWPYYSGTINVSKNIFILPQKQQIFRGKLIDSIIYPDILRDEYKPEIHKIFDYLDMNNLKSKLFMEGDWDKILSGGEKQIISIIRAIYHAPKVMILDEPTSALDQKTASILFTKILEVLHDSTIITISHDLKLKKFHDTVVDFKKFKVNSMAPKH